MQVKVVHGVSHLILRNHHTLGLNGSELAFAGTHSFLSYATMLFRSNKLQLSGDLGVNSSCSDPCQFGIIVLRSCGDSYNDFISLRSNNIFVIFIRADRLLKVEFFFDLDFLIVILQSSLAAAGENLNAEGLVPIPANLTLLVSFLLLNDLLGMIPPSDQADLLENLRQERIDSV